MELLAAVILAGPLGYFVARRRWSIALYLLAWTLLLPLQTMEVDDADTDIGVEYALVNLVILGVGLGSNWVGATLAQHRAASRYSR